MTNRKKHNMSQTQLKSTQSKVHNSILLTQNISKSLKNPIITVRTLLTACTQHNFFFVCLFVSSQRPGGYRYAALLPMAYQMSHHTRERRTLDDYRLGKLNYTHLKRSPENSKR